MADFAYVNFRKQLRLEGILPSKGSLAKHRKFLNTVQEIKTDNNFGAYIDIKTKLKQIIISMKDNNQLDDLINNKLK